jgi:hypothetical protein
LNFHLPPGANEIQTINVDYLTNHLYVVPQRRYAARGTYVYDLRSLRLLGFMPRVTEITVPVASKFEHFVSTTRLIADEAKSDELDAISGLPNENLQSTARSYRYDIRTRKNFRTVKYADFKTGSVVIDCATSARGFLGTLSGRDQKLSDRFVYKVPSVDAMLASRREIQSVGAAIACWPDGNILSANFAKPGVAMELFQLDAKRKMVSKIIGAVTYDFVPRFNTLGTAARFAFGNGFVLDFAQQQQTSIGPNDEDYILGFSRDRNTVFYGLKQYVYRSNRGPAYFINGYVEFGDFIQALSISNGKPLNYQLDLGSYITNVKGIQSLQVDVATGNECVEGQSQTDSVYDAQSRNENAAVIGYCKEEAIGLLSQYSVAELDFAKQIGEDGVQIVGVFED